MKQGELQRRIRAGEMVVGSWITIAHESIAEILANAGYDWLAVDLEHSATDYAQLQRMMQAIELGGASPFVRVAENNASQIKKVMDIGAHGVIVPMVNSADDARAVVNAVRYAPVGTRGVGLGRAQGYGADFEGYRTKREKQSVIIVQIEHRDAVEALEEILSVPGIDALLVGPYDLSASLGIPGQFTHPLMQDALKRIRKTAAKCGVPAGLHVVYPDLRQVRSAVARGFSVIVYCFDAMFLGGSARTGLAEVRAIVGRKPQPKAARTKTGRSRK